MVNKLLISIFVKTKTNSRPSLGPRWAEAQFILKQKIDDASHTICEGDRTTAPWDLCFKEFRGNI